MARKPLPSLAPDRVRLKALDVLRAAGGSLARDKLRGGISGVLTAAGLDQAVNQLVREGLIEVEVETTTYREINGQRAEFRVRVYRLTSMPRSGSGNRTDEGVAIEARTGRAEAPPPRDVRDERPEVRPASSRKYRPKPPPLTHEQLRQRFLDLLIESGPTKRGDVRHRIHPRLRAAVFDQVAAELVREGLVRVASVKRRYRTIQGHEIPHAVDEYRLTPRGERAVGGSKG